MQKGKKKISERQKNVDFDIVHWRERFVNLKKRLPKDWMKRLVEFHPSYDRHEGTLTMQAVTNNRAGLAKTAKLVGDLEEMLDAQYKPKSTFEKWKKGELISKKQ